MGISVASKVQIGFSLALAILLTVGSGALMMYVHQLETHPVIFCGSLGLVGLFLWILSWARSQQTASENPLACLGTSRHLGLLVLLSACLVYLLNSYRHHHAPPPVAVEAPKPLVQPAPVVHFPPLRLQSIVFQGARSSALINGKVVTVGEDVDQVEVLAIRPDQVTVTFQGQTNLLSLGDSAR